MILLPMQNFMCNRDKCVNYLSCKNMYLFNFQYRGFGKLRKSILSVNCLSLPLAKMSLSKNTYLEYI